MDILNAIVIICFYLLAFVPSAIAREIMAGLMAVRYGDETPRLSGRLSLNPLKHIDIFGSIIMPVALIIFGAPFMFAYAKPMSINFANIAKASGHKGCFLVALSGSFINFFIAFLCVVALKILINYNLISQESVIFKFLIILLQANIILAIFNLIPIPPLDGAKILAFFGLLFNVTIFAKMYNNFEKYGMILIILVLLIPVSNHFLMYIVNAIMMLFLQL